MNPRRLLVVLILLIVTLLTPPPACPAASKAKAFPHPDHLVYPPLPFEVPRAGRWVLKNGAVLYHLEDRRLPLIEVQVLVRGGTQWDPPGKEGLAEILAGVMRSGGAAAMTGAEIDRALENTATILDSSAGEDNFVFSLSTLREHRERSFAILGAVLTQPRFEDERLRLFKDLKTEDLRRLRDDQQRLAFWEFHRLVYGSDPRGRRPSPASVKAVEREDLVAFHRRFFFPQNMMIAVAGDIGTEEAIKVFESLLAPGSQGIVVTSPPPPRPAEPALYFIVKESPQAVIIAAQHAPPRGDGASYPFELADHIIGSGGFRSRIFQEIRTNRGLAYSTGSYYRPRRDYGIFGVYAFTAADKAAETLGEILGILEKTRASSFRDEEIAWAKKALVNSFVFLFPSPSRIVNRQMALEFNGLERDFFHLYCRRIEALTKKDIAAATASVVNPRGMVVLVVGPERILPSLRNAFGEVRRLEMRDS